MSEKPLNPWVIAEAGGKIVAAQQKLKMVKLTISN